MIHRLAGTVIIFCSGHFHNKGYRILPSDSHIKPVAFSVFFSESHNVGKTKITTFRHMEQGCGDNLSFLR